MTTNETRETFNRRMRRVVEREYNDDHCSDEERTEIIESFRRFYPDETVEGNNNDEIFVNIMSDYFYF